MSETFKTELPYHETSPSAAPPPSSSSKFPSLKHTSSQDPHISSSASLSTTSTTTTTTTPAAVYQPPIRLPTSVNIIALREAFLSEAPFVTNKNRIYWRRMIDHFNYQNLLAISFHILSDCITENSIIDLYKLYHSHLSYSSSSHSSSSHSFSSSHSSSSSSPTPPPPSSLSNKLISQLARNLAEMFFNIKLTERDLFFTKLSEILTYMIVNALRTSYPKHHRICQSIKFREILLDWFNELLSGIRNTNCRINCEWLFQDIYDVPILTTTTSSANHITSSSSSTSVSLHHHGNGHGHGNGNGNNSSSSSLTGAAAAAAAVIGTANANAAAAGGGGAPAGGTPMTTSSSSSAKANGIVRSKYTISLSPLINLYTGQSITKRTEVSMNLSLSHSVSRPLTTLACQPSEAAAAAAATDSHHGHGHGDRGTGAGTGTVLGRLKGRSLDYDQVKLLIQASRGKRREILREHKKNIKDANRDIGKYKVRYKKTLKALDQTDRSSILAMHGGTSAATSGGGGGTQQMNANAATAVATTGGLGGTGSGIGSGGGGPASLPSPLLSGGNSLRREESVNL
jgi:hypothetical protein